MISVWNLSFPHTKGYCIPGLLKEVVAEGIQVAAEEDFSLLTFVTEQREENFSPLPSVPKPKLIPTPYAQ